MAKHEFGIMDSTPHSGEVYEDYEPDLYDCISVEDELIEGLNWKTKDVKCFWHTVDRTGKGLDYCGITLIPPESLGEILKATGEDNGLSALRELLEKAKREGKFVIHFGI